MKSNSPKISFNTGAHDGNPAPDAEAVPRAPRLLAAKLSESGSAAFDAPRYVTAGFAPAEQPGPVQRNATMLAIAAIFILTFMLGITTALLWTGDNQQTAVPVNQPQTLFAQAPVPGDVIDAQIDSIAQDLNEAVTRAAVPDLMDVVGGGQSNPVVADLAAAVLEGLQARRTVGALPEGALTQTAVEPVMILSENKLRMLREGVLAGVYTIDTLDESGAKRVKLRTINAQMTSDMEGSLLMQAAAEGRDRSACVSHNG